MILDHHIHVERTSIFENVHFLLKNSGSFFAEVESFLSWPQITSVNKDASLTSFVIGPA